MTRVRLALAALALALAGPAMAQQAFAQPMVSFTFDDGYQSQYDHARPILDQYGYKGTFYLIVEALTDGFDMSVTEARRLAAGGHEIGSHTLTHPHLSQLSQPDLLDELQGSQSWLVQNVGVPDVTDFASPYGDYDSTVLDAIEQSYLSHRTTDEQLNWKDSDPYLLGEYPVDQTRTVAEVKSIIDGAVARGAWLILMIHDLSTGSPDGTYNTTVADVQAVVDYVHQHSIKVVTVAEGLAIMRASLPALSVSPSSGSTDGGTPVTVTGTGFESGATVSFGGADATDVRVISATSIHAVTPPHDAGAVAVTVTNPGSQPSTRPNAYRYRAPPPELTSISPTSGSTLGGTSVVLTGRHFAPGARVRFGTSAATVTAVSATSISVSAPAHAAGTVDVSVTNRDGLSSTLAGAYTFRSPPTLRALTPAGGSTAGGTAATLSGKGFTTGATVAFGSAAAQVVSSSATSISVMTPAHAAGTVDVSVTNPDGLSSALPGAYTFRSPPTLRSLTPASGPTAGGTAATLSGDGFTAGATVAFGSTPAQVVSSSATSISVVTPAHAAGVVDVTVTNSDGQSSSLANAYAFRSSPTLRSLTPASGPMAGGAAATLSGDGFTTGATVAFGSTAAQVVSSSATSISVVTPAHAAGVVDVTVTNSDGQSSSLADAYAFEAPPPPPGSPLAITAPSTTTPPKGAIPFSAKGGSATGYAWSFVTCASGGTIDGRGAYTAGRTGSVTDVVRVTDSLGNSATAIVRVGPGVSISPPTSAISPRGTLNFTASGGSGSGFVWSIETNASGASISAATGAYTAGPTGGSDLVRVVDTLGNSETATVSVAPGAERSTPVSSGGCGQAGGAGSLLALAALLARRRSPFHLRGTK